MLVWWCILPVLSEVRQIRLGAGYVTVNLAEPVYTPSPCDLGANYLNPACTPLSTCTPGLAYEAVPPATCSDRICSPVKQCGSNEYQGSPPTPTTDRTCVLATRCALNEHVSQLSTPSSDTVCRPRVRSCPDGYHLDPSASLDATPRTNPVNGAQCVKCPSGTTTFHPLCTTQPESCPVFHTQQTCLPLAATNWSGCPQGHYSLAGIQGHPSKSCRPCSQCENTKSECTATSDAVCALSDNPPNIQQCPPNQFRDDSIPGQVGNCTECTLCAFKDLVSPCTPTTDRKCASINSEQFVWEYTLVVLIVWFLYCVITRIVVPELRARDSLPVST